MGTEEGHGMKMTREHFNIQLGRLIVLRGWPDDIEEWWRSLQHVDSEVFTAACSHALDTRSFFPAPAELRADCDAVKALIFRPEPVAGARAVEDLTDARTVEIKNPFGGPSIFVTVTRDWKHDCDTCSDTGWASHHCGERGPRQSFAACGRKFDHAPHEYVDKCICLEWNPTIRRRKEAAMKYAQAPERAA